MIDDITPQQHRHPELVSGSIGSFTLPKRWQTQPHSKVRPNRVTLVDQIDFPGPVPVFQLLFARNRALHVAKHFKMDKPVDRIFRRMPGRCAIAMLPNAREKVRGHANVERAVKLASKNIDARVFLFSHRWSIAARWTLKQVQGDGIFALCLTNPFHSAPRQVTPSHRPLGDLNKPRHPELVSGSIVRFAPTYMETLISPCEFLGAVK